MLLFYIPVGVSFLTALYLGRLGWLIFGGKSRSPEKDLPEVHESFLMVLPIGILAALSVNLYEFSGLHRLVIKSIPPFAAGGPPVRLIAHLENGVAVLTTRAGGYAFWSFLTVLLAVLIYWNGFTIADRIRRLPVMNLLTMWIREKMYLETLYTGILVNLALLLSRIAAFIDRFFIDGILGMAVLGIRVIARLCARIEQTLLDGAVTRIASLVNWGGNLIGGKPK
jgi:NADH:ubiquinone oxidoreductase subunit 5 (subunit L)/multisubunit Na+/H+ antiporter MnhA subunit